MPLVTPNPISQVQWESVVDTEGLEHPRQIRVTWMVEGQQDYLVQVYLNGVLYDVTSDPSQRFMWIAVDRSKEHRIELLAVTPDSAWTDYRDRVSEWPTLPTAPTVQVQRHPDLDPFVNVKMSAQGEVIGQTPLWPNHIRRGGWGGVFGVGDFGFDLHVGVGHGRGQFGSGPLGSDGDVLSLSIDNATLSGPVTVHLVDQHETEVLQETVQIPNPIAMPPPFVPDWNGVAVGP